MKQFIKSYHLFLSPRWLRLTIYLFYPVLMIFLFAFLGTRISAIDSPAETKGEMIYFLLGTLWDFIVAFEIFTDYIVFGGITENETHKLEYLKTSVKGMPVLKKSVIADAIRRLLSISVIIIPATFFCCPSISMSGIMTTILVLFSFAELGLIITRRFPSLAVHALTISGFTLILPVIMSRILQAPLGIKLILPAIMAIIVCIPGRWHIIWKARNSYYDNRDEKELKAE